MNRNYKTLCYLLFCLGALAFLFFPSGVYRTPMDVFNANAVGMQVGPDIAIKSELHHSDSAVTIIGLWEDGLFTTETTKKAPFLWGLAPTVTGYRETRQAITADTVANAAVVGLVAADFVPDVAELTVDLEFWPPNGGNAQYLGTVTTQDIDADGYFCISFDMTALGDAISDDFGAKLREELRTAEEENGRIGRHLTFVRYLEGRNADGEIVYQSGIAQDGSEYDALLRDIYTARDTIPQQKIADYLQ